MTANCITPELDVGQNAAPGIRRCLGCRIPFASGGCHEWVCPHCKESEVWQAGLGEYACHPESTPKGETE
jgi:hypothetical protein